ncbi:hypothetical protein Tco_1435782, partial [Tanacetum coccineum]
MSRSADRPAATSRGGVTGRRIGSKGRRVREPRRRNVEPTSELEGQASDQSVEYDGKGGAIVYTRWIEKMKLVQDMSSCGDNQKVKYTADSFVGKALTWWNSQICTLGREVVV